MSFNRYSHVKVGVFGVAFCAAMASLSASAQPIERPTVKVGDECRYDIFDNLRKDAQGNPEKIAESQGLVTSVDDGRIQTSWAVKKLVDRDTEDIVSGVAIFDRNLNDVEWDNGRKLDGPYPRRFYPLAPGSARKGVRTKFPRVNGDGEIAIELDGKASGWEKATVPAGSFDVIRIVWDGTYSVRIYPTYVGAGAMHQEFALSPATWCDVHGTYRDTRSGSGDNGVWSDRSWKLTGYKN